MLGMVLQRQQAIHLAVQFNRNCFRKEEKQRRGLPHAALPDKTIKTTACSP